MSRNPRQTKGLAEFGSPRSNHSVGHTDSQTTKRDAAKFDEVTKTRLKKPPHRHVWINGVCKICNEPEQAVAEFERLNK